MDSGNLVSLRRVGWRTIAGRQANPSFHRPIVPINKRWWSAEPTLIEDMLRAAIAHFVAGMLMLHSVLGCCWHHAHACAHGDCAWSESTADDAHSHACSDDSHGDDCDAGCQSRGDESSRGNHSSLECPGACVYLPPEKAISANHGPEGVAGFVAIPAAMALWVLSPVDAREWISDSERIEPPLRLHLLHQILLI